MFKNRFLLVLGVLSLLLVTMAVSRPFSSASVSGMEGANDFYQRHPNWNRNLEASDYYERHPELTLSVSAVSAADLTDYFSRHPELRTPNTTTDLSDYFQRH